MSDNEDYNIEDSDIDKKEDDEDDKTIDDVLSGDEISDDEEASNNVNEDSENDMEDDDDIYESNDEDVTDDDSDSENENDADHLYGGGKSKKSTPRKKKVSEEGAEPQEAFKNIETYSDDEDDDDDDENYLQKFDREVNRNYILEQHPECVNHNYDEIVALAKVVRDKDNNIVDPLHRTIPFLTKFEKARILGQRAKQIESGARPFVEVPEKIIEGNIIALLELQQKRLPFIIRRPLPSGGSEYWHLSDLDMIDF